jgi:hypothetical protein
MPSARDRDRLLDLMDPEIEFRSVFERKTYRGLAEMVQYRDDLEGEVYLDQREALEAAGLSQ